MSLISESCDSNFSSLQQVGSDQLKELSRELLITPTAEIFCCHFTRNVNCRQHQKKKSFQMSFRLSIYQIFSRFVCEALLINKLFIFLFQHIIACDAYHFSTFLSCVSFSPAEDDEMIEEPDT